MTASSKVYPDAARALSGILKDGMTLCCGGFGLCGVPERLIAALYDSGVRNLTVGVQQRRHRPAPVSGCC